MTDANIARVKAQVGAVVAELEEVLAALTSARNALDEAVRGVDAALGTDTVHEAALAGHGHLDQASDEIESARASILAARTRYETYISAI